MVPADRCSATVDLSSSPRQECLWNTLTLALTDQPVCMLHAPHIWTPLTWSSQKYMRKNTNYKVPNYATVPSLKCFMSLTSKYCSKYPVFKHPQFSKSLSVINPGFSPTRTMNMVDCEVLKWKGLAMRRQPAKYWPLIDSQTCWQGTCFSTPHIVLQATQSAPGVLKVAVLSSARHVPTVACLRSVGEPVSLGLPPLQPPTDSWAHHLPARAMESLPIT